MMTLYKIDFPNGKGYAGVTYSLKARRRTHRDAALQGSTLPIHKAIRKYGVNEFELIPLVVGPDEYILDLEPKVIEAFKFRDRKLGYNVSYGGSASPMKTPEIAAKVAAKNRGRKFSDARRAQLSALGKGRKHSSEAIANMCVAQKGRIITDAAREKLRVYHLGRTASEETRAKMRAKKIGNTLSKGYVWTEEQRINLGKIRKGHLVSDAQREKVRAALKGRSLSEEAKAKLRIGQANRRARERAEACELLLTEAKS